MIAFRGQTELITAVATATTINLPLQPSGVDNPGTAPQPGDLCLLYLSSVGGSSYQTVTLPAGWVTVRPFDNMKTGTTTATQGFGCWAKILTADDIAAGVDYTQTDGSTNLLRWMAWFSGITTGATLQPGAYAGRRDTGSGATTTTAVAPSITLPRPGTALVIAAERTIASETSTQIVASGSVAFSQVYFKLANDQTVTMFAADHPAGDTGTVTVTYPNTHNNNAGAVILGIVDPLAPDPGSGFSVRLGAQVGTLRVGTPSGLKNILGARMIQPKYGTVADMLADDEFYWAHRGGSIDFPEMSEYAYGQSALLGWPVLEMSLSRTSDGVWFGLHDQHLDRVSLGATGSTLDPTQTTWAQVQQYQILGSVASGNPTQPSRQFARLESVLDKYPGHLFVIDPKYQISSSRANELLDILDSRGGNERFIMKWFGVGNGQSDYVSACRSRSYEVWGYFYQSNVETGLVQEQVERFTLIGMDYLASQASWDTLKAVAGNRRMIGHICPNQAAVDTARSKGATGFQCSGVRAIRPR